MWHFNPMQKLVHMCLCVHVLVHSFKMSGFIICKPFETKWLLYCCTVEVHTPGRPKFLPLILHFYIISPIKCCNFKFYTYFYCFLLHLKLSTHCCNLLFHCLLSGSLIIFCISVYYSNQETRVEWPMVMRDSGLYGSLFSIRWKVGTQRNQKYYVVTIYPYISDCCLSDMIGEEKRKNITFL